MARAMSDSSVNYLEEATINSRISSYNVDASGKINVGRGVMNYFGYGTGSFWGHAGNGMSSHSSMMGYNPTKGFSAVILTNLSPNFITNQFQFHHDIVAILNSHF